MNKKYIDASRKVKEKTEEIDSLKLKIIELEKNVSSLSCKSRKTRKDDEALIETRSTIVEEQSKESEHNMLIRGINILNKLIYLY